jgi:hypothetical protein
MSDPADEDDGPCEFWDEDGCYCVCGSACACEQRHAHGQSVSEKGK